MADESVLRRELDALRQDYALMQKDYESTVTFLRAELAKYKKEAEDNRRGRSNLASDDSDAPPDDEFEQGRTQSEDFDAIFALQAQVLSTKLSEAEVARATALNDCARLEKENQKLREHIVLCRRVIHQHAKQAASVRKRTRRKVEPLPTSEEETIRLTQLQASQILRNTSEHSLSSENKQLRQISQELAEELAQNTMALNSTMQANRMLLSRVEELEKFLSLTSELELSEDLLGTPASVRRLEHMLNDLGDQEQPHDETESLSAQPSDGDQELSTTKQTEPTLTK
ncbi:MAG: hypothetical protein MHM6MM_001226 [Cercozoa sp. M6MM]